MTVGNKYLASC